MSKNENGEERLQEIKRLVRTREEEYKDKTPKLKVGSHEVTWRDYAKNTVLLVTAIGDVAINFAPAPSSIVWSAVKVLLKTNVSQCEDIAAILGCTEQVLGSIRLGKVYEVVYVRDMTQNEATLHLHDSLVDLYKAVLELLGHAYTRLKEGQGRQFLRALICDGEGANLLSALAEHKSKTESAAQAFGAVMLQENERLLQSLKEPLGHMEDIMKNVLEEIQDGNMRQALEYISNIPVGAHQLEKQEARTPETCEWLLKDARFVEWEESNTSSILWLQGSIGAGKSFLTSKVIDELKKLKNDKGFAYFYCSHSDEMRQDAKDILPSYLCQLTEISQHPTGMHKAVLDTYRQAQKDKRGFSKEESKTALIELVNFRPRTTLILDALDECGLTARRELVGFFRSLVEANKKTKQVVKIFIASRKEVDIQEALRSQNLVEIGTTNNKADIEKYIVNGMRSYDIYWNSFPDNFREEVKGTIVDQSNGMFRWAYLQCEQLKELKTIESIRKRLGKLPRSLTDAYYEIYCKNEDQEKKILERAVKWVYCAREPLKSEVLLWAIRLESQQDKNAEEALAQLDSPINESTLESICSQLVVIDSQLKVWKFPHASVAEFFEGLRKDWIKEAYEDVTILLISCLIDCYSNWTQLKSEEDVVQFLFNEPGPDDYLDAQHPLLTYTNRYWVQHVQNISSRFGEAIGVSSILKRFLGGESPQKSSSRQYQAWCSHMSAWSSLADDELEFVDELLPAEKSIFAICTFGFHELLKDWWYKDLDVSQMNLEDMDLLAIAAKYGHNELCSELIGQGADVNKSLESFGGSALGEAIRRSQVETVKLLLDKGCDPKLVSKYSTPICIAAKNQGRWVELFLEKGVDPNIQCQTCPCGCALEGATIGDNVDTARLLINYGANANIVTKNGVYGSPLAAAAFRGSLECAKLFVEHNAEVNARLENGQFGGTLAAALFGFPYNVEMVAYLIEEAGADASVLCSSPLRIHKSLRDTTLASDTRKGTKYLVQGGHVTRQALLDIGFHEDEVPEEEDKNI